MQSLLHVTIRFMSDPKPKEQIYAKGKIFELVHIQVGDKVFEIARRAPGVRIIVPNKVEKKLLLTKEFRRELDDWDYRLPGGKVFDTLDEFEAFRTSGGNMLDAAMSKGKGEGAEEAGVDISDLVHFKTSVLGATVEWDLWVFEATDWQRREEGQKLEHGEIVETDNWFSYEEVKHMILEGKMQEERIALILLQWINEQG